MPRGTATIAAQTKTIAAQTKASAILAIIADGAGSRTAITGGAAANASVTTIGATHGPSIIVSTTCASRRAATNGENPMDNTFLPLWRPA